MTPTKQNRTQSIFYDQKIEANLKITAVAQGDQDD